MADTAPEPVPSMSPLEAAQLLYRMADAAPGNGADHRAKDEAAKVLSTLLAPPADPDPDA
jgi:hypothetical protein